MSTNYPKSDEEKREIDALNRAETAFTVANTAIRRLHPSRATLENVLQRLDSAVAGLPPESYLKALLVEQHHQLGKKKRMLEASDWAQEPEHEHDDIGN